MNIDISLTPDEWQRLMDAVTFAQSCTDDWPPDEWDEHDMMNFNRAVAKLRGLSKP